MGDYLVPPMPFFVKCPECGYDDWLKRKTDSKRRTECCPSCGLRVVPEVVPNRTLNLMRCENCHEFHWYRGKKLKTSCPHCHSTTKVKIISPDELQQFIQEQWDGIKEENQQYYLDLLLVYK